MILGSLSVATVQLVTADGQSENLAQIAVNLGFEPSESVCELLLELDEKLDAKSLLKLISHLAGSIPYQKLEGR